MPELRVYVYKRYGLWPFLGGVFGFFLVRPLTAFASYAGACRAAFRHDNLRIYRHCFGLTELLGTGISCLGFWLFMGSELPVSSRLIPLAVLAALWLSPLLLVVGVSLFWRKVALFPIHLVSGPLRYSWLLALIAIGINTSKELMHVVLWLETFMPYDRSTLGHGFRGFVLLDALGALGSYWLFARFGQRIDGIQLPIPFKKT